MSHSLETLTPGWVADAVFRMGLVMWPSLGVAVWFEMVAALGSAFPGRIYWIAIVPCGALASGRCAPRWWKRTQPREARVHRATLVAFFSSLALTGMQMLTIWVAD